MCSSDDHFEWVPFLPDNPEPTFLEMLTLEVDILDQVRAVAGTCMPSRSTRLPIPSSKIHTGDSPMQALKRCPACDALSFFLWPTGGGKTDEDAERKPFARGTKEASLPLPIKIPPPPGPCNLSAGCSKPYHPGCTWSPPLNRVIPGVYLANNTVTGGLQVRLEW